MDGWGNGIPLRRSRVSSDFQRVPWTHESHKSLLSGMDVVCTCQMRNSLTIYSPPHRGISGSLLELGAGGCTARENPVVSKCGLQGHILIPVASRMSRLPSTGSIIIETGHAQTHPQTPNVHYFFLQVSVLIGLKNLVYHCQPTLPAVHCELRFSTYAYI